VGRQGFEWSGVATIRDKQEWPDWYPPKEMLQRQSEIMREMQTLRIVIGMAGGPRNPLGARAMYLWQGNKGQHVVRPGGRISGGSPSLVGN